MTDILLADDDGALRTVMKIAFEGEGYTVQEAVDGAEATSLIRAGDFKVIVLDVMMPEKSGFECLETAHRYAPDTPVVIVSANATLNTALSSKAKGAFDYIPKPFDISELIDSINKAVEHGASLKPSAPREHEGAEDAGRLVGQSPAMQQIFKMISRMTDSEFSVLITGETGSGKEHVARTIHAHSPRKNKPFLAVNMAAIPENLIESTLFGHERGAFTGADRRKVGTFQQADGGTLFLDEIGDMPLSAQTRLLRVLQEGEFTPVGSERSVKSDVRVISATHQNLAQRVKEGSFREDLFYRINVIPITVPPLRERKDDIPELARIFLSELNPHMRLNKAAEKVLKQHGWPGNVRELKNIMARAVVNAPSETVDGALIEHCLKHSGGIIDGLCTPANDLSEGQGLEDMIAKLSNTYNGYDLYAHIISQVEKPLIEHTLERTAGNQIKAAEILGLNRNTLRAKIRALDIKVVRGMGTYSDKGQVG